MHKILVTGGCGYIGSHTIVDLLDCGFQVVSVDSHIHSKPEILEGIRSITGKSVQNYKIDLCDLKASRQIFKDHPDISGIIHFAAFKSVSESVEQPLKYYQNNLNSLLNILACVEEFEIPHFIFSSSCSVYGNVKQLPATEDTPFAEAESPYAHTKQIGEGIVERFAQAFPHCQAILLRYFNPAGAHPTALIGEEPQQQVFNIVPVLMEVVRGIRPEFTVHGGDYNTRDGSCVRDYIYIMDLANAHTKSLQYLIDKKNTQSCEVFNVGSGEGVSVLEFLKAFENNGIEGLKYSIGPRRSGDVEAIYANHDKATSLLGWKPRFSVDDIVRTAWAWDQQRLKK